MRALKVLVVEDEPTNREVAEVILRSNGHEVVSVENGRVALSLLETRRDFDLILMDVLMPELDGLAATRLIRADSALGHIPIVVLSARASGSDRSAGLAAGADGYLTKPFKRGDLLAALADILGRKGVLSADESIEMKESLRVARPPR